MNDYRKEAVKQFLKYFVIWFLGVVLTIFLTIVLGIIHLLTPKAVRTNTSAPLERVYDYADILTDEEEDMLRQHIAQAEAEYKADFVVVTSCLPVEGELAIENGLDSEDWETNMMNLADDFWDTYGYGYNKGFEGDGALLLDNRYEGQRGEWLSTSGKVENRFGTYEVDCVLDAVDRYYDSNPYKAYISFVDETCSHLPRDGIHLGFFYYLMAIVGSLIVAYNYAKYHLKKNNAKDTVAINAYITDGKAIVVNEADNFIRKNVVTRRIETSTSSGSSGGGGGHHRSSSGASHGGGGRRH